MHTAQSDSSLAYPFLLAPQTGDIQTTRKRVDHISLAEADDIEDLQEITSPNNDALLLVAEKQNGNVYLDRKLSIENAKTLFGGGQSVDTDLINEVKDLENKTSDLHAGVPATGWSDVNSDGTQGGLAVISGDYNLAGFRAVTTWSVNLNRPSPTDNNYLGYRIPKDANPAQYQYLFGGPRGRTYSQKLNSLSKIGSSADNMWDYYAHSGSPVGANVLTAKLQVTGSEAHIGTSEFRGNLLRAKVLGALGVSSIAENERTFISSSDNLFTLDKGSYVGVASDNSAGIPDNINSEDYFLDIFSEDGTDKKLILYPLTGTKWYRAYAGNGNTSSFTKSNWSSFDKVVSNVETLRAFSNNTTALNASRAQVYNFTRAITAADDNKDIVITLRANVADSNAEPALQMLQELRISAQVFRTLGAGAIVAKGGNNFIEGNAYFLGSVWSRDDFQFGAAASLYRNNRSGVWLIKAKDSDNNVIQNELSLVSHGWGDITECKIELK